MKNPHKAGRFAFIAKLLGLIALTLPAVADTIYFDDFNDQQNINSGGPYSQTLAGSVPTTRIGTLGGSASATWQAGVEAGGWGQRSFGNNGVATPTSSNFLPFTPDPNLIYTVQATIDTTPLGGADPGGTGSWFALGFTSSQHNWNGADAATIDVAHLVRWYSNNVTTITYTVSGATLSAAGIQYVGWITDRAGTVNLNGAGQVKIDNFSLTSGVANPTLTYDGNGSDGGTVPSDGASPYAFGATATALEAGTMTRTGYSFLSWNTASDGTGTTYQPNDTFTITNHTTLYAKWLAVGSYTLIYNGNGNTTGSVPVDGTSPYNGGSTVTVLGNTGSLARNSFTFNGWNTSADGSGTSYSPNDTFTIGANTTLFARWTPGPDYIWNNGDLSNSWNTDAIDANWSGATWSNSATHNAYFTTGGGSVYLDSSIVANAVNVGGAGANFSSFGLLEGLGGNGLSATSLTVQGSSSNGGSYGSNPTLTVNSAVNFSGDAAIGRANLAITGGTFTANRIISAPASADWARLVVSGGTVTATNGVDGSVNTGATFAIDLNGGELQTPSIRVADREVGFNNYAWLTFNGGTIKAIGADNADFITTYGGGQTTFVAGGGAIIDTNGRNLGLTINMVRSGSSTGGLTKNGSGTLNLAGLVYNYRGNTLINDGALNVSSVSSMEFFPSTNGITNSVSAGSTTASLSFLGKVYLNLGAADATGGNTWNLFNLASFTPTPVLTPTLVDSTLGAFSPAATPGVWELPVTGAKWVFSATNGNLAYVVTATPYETWGSLYGLAAGSEGGDLDGDGMTNLQEYAFGLIPNSGSSVNPIAVLLDKATGKFRYTRRATPSSTGLAYTVWTSTDLTNWTEDTGATSSQTVTGTVDEVETVEATISGTLPLTQPKLFIQVRAN
jgi:uncharacterized repeat protein (TIGR02543 family)